MKRTKKRSARAIGRESSTVISTPRRRQSLRDSATLQFIRRHRFTLAAAVVSIVICFWMITEGTGVIPVHGGFDAFYDGQAESMAHGHWDVSPDAVLGEAFIVHGKYYGYFGFTPALPRILLNRLFPWMYGRWTRALMLLWIAIAIAAIIAFMDEFGVASDPFLLVVAVFGSTLIFLCSHAIVYHEAIITGSGLALWAYLFFCRYLRQPSTGILAAAGVLSFLSFFARPTSGAGPILFASFLCAALLLGLLRRGQSWLGWFNFPSPLAAAKHAMILALCVAISGATYIYVNHAKFGTLLNQVPLEYHVQYNAERLARIDGTLNHLSNIPFSLGAYFRPDRIEFRKQFPWFALTAKGPSNDSGAKFDMVDRYASIPAAMPGLAILSILGIAAAVRGRPDWRRRVLPVIAAALTAGCMILIVGATSYRYEHDFYPFLVISAILGMGALQSISGRRLRLTVKALFIVAGVWSIAANSAFALQWQREGMWPSPEGHAAFLRMRRRVDSMFPFAKADSIRYNIGDNVQAGDLDAPWKGELLTVVDPPATYRYDGRRWNYISGVPMHQFRMHVRFPRGEPNIHMALWFAGRFGSSDAVFIVYSNPTQVSFCSDHWGTGVVCGPAMEIQTDREYLVQIDADRLNSLLTVQLDGRKVLEAPIEFHMWTDRDVLFGKSLAPAAHGGEFTGEIRQDAK